MAVYDPRGGGNVHIDVALSQISLAYPNNGMVGDNLFNVVNVNKQSDKYYEFGREGWSVHPGGDLRAPGTVANEIEGLLVSVNPYFAQEHSLQIPITDEERENADSPLSPDRDGVELVTSKLLLAREIAIKDIYNRCELPGSAYCHPCWCGPVELCQLCYLESHFGHSSWLPTDPLGSVLRAQPRHHSLPGDDAARRPSGLH